MFSGCMPAAHALLLAQRTVAKCLAGAQTRRYSEITPPYDPPRCRLPGAVERFRCLARCTRPTRARPRRRRSQFGVDVAQRGLWREAIYRWEKRHRARSDLRRRLNNLAVAYEHEGQFDKARQTYEKAIAIEPNNVQIKQNYDLFKEINDRAARQERTSP